jgi:predicted HicB family RNase H-like nuclease
VRQRKQILLQIRIPADLHKRLAEDARTNERSMTSHARWILATYLSKESSLSESGEKRP